MKDELISLETAILAKEKEFDIYTDYIYIQVYEHLSYNYYKNEEYIEEEGEPFAAHRNILPDEAPYHTFGKAPTQSLLQKWLRDKYTINIVIDILEIPTSIKSGIRYSWRILNKNSTSFDIYDESLLGYLTYEEALEKALQEALKLI